MDEKKKLSELLSMEEVAIPAYSVFIEYGHLQHWEFGWLSPQSLGYQTYPISWSYDLKDTVASSIGGALL